MSGTKLRRDILRLPDGHVNVAWGLLHTGSHPTRTEGLFLLYSVKEREGLPQPLKYAPDVTHELTGFVIEGSQIDFEKNLWEQKKLRPAVPAVVAFQFKARSDAHAVKQVQEMMHRIVKGYAMPSVMEHWLDKFPHAIDLSKPIREFDDPEADVQVLDEDLVDDAIMLSCSTCRLPKEYRDPLPRPKPSPSRVALSAGFVLGLISLGAVASEAYQIASSNEPGRLGLWQSEQLYIEADGREWHLILTKLPGLAHRSAYVLDNQPLTIYPHSPGAK